MKTCTSTLTKKIKIKEERQKRKIHSTGNHWEDEAFPY